MPSHTNISWHQSKSSLEHIVHSRFKNKPLLSQEWPVSATRVYPLTFPNMKLNWNILTNSQFFTNIIIILGCQYGSSWLSQAPPVSIIHCPREVFKAISCIGTELLYVCSSWPSYHCASMWRGSRLYVASEFVLNFSNSVQHISIV